MNKNINLWERQPGETAKAYSYFSTYRDMGPGRTHEKVAAHVGRAKITISQMARKWNWGQRVKAYTDEMERLKMEAKKKAIADMAHRHAQHAQAIETSLMVPVKIFINKINNNELRSLKNLPDETLMKLVFNVADKFPNIVNTERKSRGVPTEISNIDHTTKGKAIQSATWDSLKNAMLKNLEQHPEAKESLLKTLDEYVNTGKDD